MNDYGLLPESKSKLTQVLARLRYIMYVVSFEGGRMLMGGGLRKLGGKGGGGD